MCGEHISLCHFLLLAWNTYDAGGHEMTNGRTKAVRQGWWQRKLVEPGMSRCGATAPALNRLPPDHSFMWHRQTPLGLSHSCRVPVPGAELTRGHEDSGWQAASPRAAPKLVALPHSRSLPIWSVSSGVVGFFPEHLFIFPSLLSFLSEHCICSLSQIFSLLVMFAISS